MILICVTIWNIVFMISRMRIIIMDKNGCTVKLLLWKKTYKWEDLEIIREDCWNLSLIHIYGDGTKGKSLAMTYGYNSTKFTDNKGRKEIYRFDNNGNLLHVHDGFGHAVSCKYNVDGNHVNRLENATKLQDLSLIHI